jgi:hypothetical protein
VLIDMNQILHVILRRSRNNEQATKLLMVELDMLIQRVKPISSLVLAIDGSPAAAKVATQRKRRFSILKNTKFKLKHSSKLRMSKSKRAKRLRNYKSELQSLQLTPGTKTMQTMEAAVLYWAWQRLHSQGRPHSRLLPKVRIYVSSSLVPGEGEIKMLEWINNNRGKLSRKPGQSIALIGGDADLLLEAMIIPPSWTHNVFVLRPEDAINPNKQNNHRKKKQGNGNNNQIFGKKYRKNLMHCTSLWEMTLSLDDYCRNTFPKECYNPEENPEDQNLLLQIRTDMVLLFILNGNDYLPRVVAVGFKGVLKNYLALLEKWIQRDGSIENVGLIDPNTLSFRSGFCADFFRLLGQGAPSQKERLRTFKQSATKTHQAMLNDMSAIGFIPQPVFFRILGDDEEEGIEVIELQDQDIEAEDEDEDEDIDIEEEDDEESLEALEDSHDMRYMQLALGKKSDGDYHEYTVRVNTTSSKFIKKAKGALSKMVLEEFELLEYIENDDLGRDYDWEIDIPAPANIGRYLGGLIWTLQTYQDGVCPTYQYNYGKCLAPTGTEIAAYFKRALKEKRVVGADDLLGDFEPGGSISAGAACLAALPTSMKHLVPTPYSLIGDKVVEDIYSQCMNKTDNFFHLKKFETLLEAELERLAVKGIADEKSSLSDFVSNRNIVLGDHYWTVLKRTHDVLQFPFKPPPPPGNNFSGLRSNGRIKASRIISMDFPSPRHSINYTVSDLSSTESNYPRKFFNRNNIEIDHSSFGSFTDGSVSSISEVPYKIAFGSSPDIYGNSQKKSDRQSFELLETIAIDESKQFQSSNGFDVPKHKIRLNEKDGYEHSEGLRKRPSSSKKNTENQQPVPKHKIRGNEKVYSEGLRKRIPSSKKNPENQQALVVLKQLVDIQLVGSFDFSKSPDEECRVTLSFDKVNGGLPLKDMTFTLLRHPADNLKSVKQHLSSLALDEIIRIGKARNNGKIKNENFGPETRWHDLTLQDMKEFLHLHYSLVQKTAALNSDKQNSIMVLKQLRDIGLVKSYGFIEAPATSDTPEKHLLSLRIDSSESTVTQSTSSSATAATTRPETLSFSRYRMRSESKKWTRQELVSTALNTIIAEGTTSEVDGDPTAYLWFNLSFEDIKDRLERRMYR